MCFNAVAPALVGKVDVEYTLLVPSDVSHLPEVPLLLGYVGVEYVGRAAFPLL